MGVSSEPIGFTSRKSGYAIIGNTTGIVRDVAIADAYNLISAAAPSDHVLGRSHVNSAHIIVLAINENTIFEEFNWLDPTTTEIILCFKVSWP